jgi:hypothetical protein
MRGAHTLVFRNQTVLGDRLAAAQLAAVGFRRVSRRVSPLLKE